MLAEAPGAVISSQIGVLTPFRGKMETVEFEAHRRTIRTDRGELSCIDIGEGPTTVFVHGVCFGAHVWRNVVGAIAGERRRIAIDLPAHGQSRTTPDQDLSLRANAALLDALLEELYISDVDLVGNDTGGALCQVFAVRHPARLRTLTLTNCDADDNLPPAEFTEGKALAEMGQLGAVLGAMARDPDLARNAEKGYNLTFEHPELISDEQIRIFTAPFTDPERASELDRFAVSTKVDDLLAINPHLSEINVPTLIVWGTGDIFFEVDWAYWLRDRIPGTKQVVEIEGGKLLFPLERADDFIPHLRRFLDEHSPLAITAER
jgi:pimeloyl-ACP methyl ester carboxylesterase